MNNNEPIVLGKVKKGSAGKPLVVIIVFLFIGALIFYLPTVASYFGDYNIIELIKEGKIIDFFINHDLYVDKPIVKEEKEEEKIEPLLINDKTILNFNNIALSDFDLKTEYIKFKIDNKNNINLNQDNKDIATIKLTNEEEITFNFKGNLKSIVEVKGIIKIIKEHEYPSYTALSDESGLGSFICVRDNYKIEYVLSNNNLIKVKETLNYIDTGVGYLEKFEEYSNLVTNLINKGHSKK